MERIDSLLPSGTELKSLIAENNAVPTGILKELLFNRGVFVCSGEKDNTVPILSKTLISPKEFDTLCNSLTEKEHSIKVSTEEIICNDNTSLIDMTEKLDIIKNLNLPNIKPYSIDSPLKFTFSSENSGIVDLRITSYDRTKNWFNIENKYAGMVKAEKTGNLLTLTSEYTSKNTKEIISKTQKVIKTYLKNNNFVTQENLDQAGISSDDFTNIERVKFMLSLANNSPTGILEYVSIVNADIGPDDLISTPMPKGAEWMRNTIKNFIASGKDLAQLEFIKEKEYHEYILTKEFTVRYKFSYHAAKGNCYIQFGFPQFFKKDENISEFLVTINPDKIYPDKGYKEISKTSIARELHKQFELLKKQALTEIKK